MIALAIITIANLAALVAMLHFMRKQLAAHSKHLSSHDRSVAAHHDVLRALVRQEVQDS